MKIVDDKYYTPINLANYCYNKVDQVIGVNNIDRIIEPSCGNGAFFHNDKLKPTIGIDINPEINGSSIITSDYLSVDLIYQKNTLVIGNPPYGSRLNLAQKFFKKSIQIADYVAFILPISQLDNIQSFYEFDLIYSEDLGERDYSGRKLHCCFNIYKRPKSGKFNKKPLLKLPYLTIKRNDSKGYTELTDYDIRMCGWGDGSAGKILSQNDKLYACEYKIKIKEDFAYRQQIIDFFNTFDWNGLIQGISMKRLKQFHIIEELRKRF